MSPAACVNAMQMPRLTRSWAQSRAYGLELDISNLRYGVVKVLGPHEAQEPSVTEEGPIAKKCLRRPKKVLW